MWDEMNARDFETYYPCIRVNPVNPRARKNKPYFPGYLFVKVNPDVGDADFRWLPGSNGLVRFGGEVAIVSEGIINAIRSHVEKINARGMNSVGDFHQGDSVEILETSFAGYEAIFDTRIPGSDRVRVLLKMANSRMLPVLVAGERVKGKNQT